MNAQKVYEDLKNNFKNVKLEGNTVLVTSLKGPPVIQYRLDFTPAHGYIMSAECRELKRPPMIITNVHSGLGFTTHCTDNSIKITDIYEDDSDLSLILRRMERAYEFMKMSYEYGTKSNDFNVIF